MPIPARPFCFITIEHQNHMMLVALETLLLYQLRFRRLRYFHFITLLVAGLDLDVEVNLVFIRFK